MAQLVLSLFPGIGLLDMAFEEAGFCIVRGPDVLWGGDIRKFHPPAGKFDGVIGGPPCQCFSIANNRRGANNNGNKIGNLIPEFERCVIEVVPRWFLMENVRQAPLPVVPGFVVADYIVKNRWFGAAAMRTRRFSFGNRGHRVPLLIQPEVFQNQRITRAILASDGKRDGRGNNYYDRKGCLSEAKFTFPEACELQGLSPDFFANAPFTKEGKWRCVGNGVPLPMGRAIAKAVLEATE